MIRIIKERVHSSRLETIGLSLLVAFSNHDGVRHATKTGGWLRTIGNRWRRRRWAATIARRRRRWRRRREQRRRRRFVVGYRRRFVFIVVGSARVARRHGAGQPTMDAAPVDDDRHAVGVAVRCGRRRRRQDPQAARVHDGWLSKKTGKSLPAFESRISFTCVPELCYLMPFVISILRVFECLRTSKHFVK